MVPISSLGCGPDAFSLADTRYVVVEPPHHVAPVKMEQFFFDLIVAGYVPILTHPERLSWIESQYSGIQRLIRGGVWMQVTAASLTGAFGRSAQYWANRMLDEGCVCLATDARRAAPAAPGAGRDLARRVGARESTRV
jgi:protein-tyrosine phosphatase